MVLFILEAIFLDPLVYIILKSNVVSFSLTSRLYYDLIQIKGSFLSLECRVALHDILQMLIDESIQPGQIVLVIYDRGIGILIGRELNEILGLLGIELNSIINLRFSPLSFQMPPHLFDFDEAFALRVEHLEGGEKCLGVVRLEISVLENCVTFVFVPLSM